MRGAVFSALSAAMGNGLQGWDNATLAAAIIYVKIEFKLETRPTLEGLIVAMSLIGATCSTTFSGPAADRFGRRIMLIYASVFFVMGGAVLLWSPNVYVLLLGRLLTGLGVGLCVSVVPIYISETAPSEVRGQINTLPQLTGSGGMFLSYCTVFGMSLMKNPNWRLMLGILSFPSMVYVMLMVCYLPESPRWLVSKGRMEEAKRVLKRLRGKEDVAGEMALLVEGLGTGGDTSIEEYVIEAENDESLTAVDKNHIKLYGPDQGQSWIARPVTGQSTLGMASRYGSVATPNQNNNPTSPFMDPVVTLFGSVHENIPNKSGGGSMRSMLFPNFQSMFGNQDADVPNPNPNQDEENPPPPYHYHHHQHDDYASDDDQEDRTATGVRAPLLSNLPSGVIPHGSSIMRNSSLMRATGAEGEQLLNSTDIGGGWQLAYKYTETKGEGGRAQGEYKRVFLKQEGAVGGSMRGSLLSFAGGPAEDGGGQLMVQAAALVSQSAIKIQDPNKIGTGAIQPTEEVTKGGQEPGWKELCEPGVKRALAVGVGIQAFQQFCGISGVQYYTPQILQQAGVGALVSGLGLNSASTSVLLSAITNMLMLPAIIVAMRIMDVAGRRALLLNTIPFLVGALSLLVFSNTVHLGASLSAGLSMTGLVVYCCAFVMGYGPVPNILCSEIFPTRARGLCIAVCSLTFWVTNIMVTYSLPTLMSTVGLVGVFTTYGIVCAVSFVFVYLKVPETKGMPLEVISEFFNVGAKQTMDESG